MFAPYFRTRVARRLYALFVGLAVIPAGLVGGYAYHQVTGNLLDAALQDVREQTKSVGMEVLTRLNALSDELRLVAALIEHGIDAPETLTTGFTHFGQSDTEAGLSVRQRSHLSGGHFVLESIPANQFRLLWQPPHQSQQVWGVLKADAMWPETVRGISYCLVDSGNKPLHCSPGAAGLLQKVELQFDQHSSAFSARLDEADYLLAHWQLPLEPMFAHDLVTVVGFQARNSALSSVIHFQRVFPALLGLILLVAVWLAMRQIKRQMAPLDTLVDASKLIGHGEFSVRVPQGQQDEFGELSAVFNRMVSGLQRKFELLEALSRLDQAVLSNAQIQDVIEAVLGHLPAVTGCQHVAILMPEPADIADRARLHYRFPERDSSIRQEVIHLDKQTREWLTTDQACLECPSGLLPTDFAQPFLRRGIASLWLLPVRIDQQQVSALILGFAEPPDEFEERLQAARSLADRLKMATSNLALEDALYHKVHYDALTGLPSLVLLRDRVEQAMSSASRDQRAMTLMFVDLYKFRDINDSLGHDAGDRVLVIIAGRLQSAIRKVDTVSRYGADKFVVLLTELEADRAEIAASHLAEHLIETIARPIELGRQSICIGASVGIALYPSTSSRFEDLLKGAESAMYEAKQLNPGSYRFHSSAIEERTRCRFERIQQLRQAFAKNEFTLYYQPKVEAHSGRITSAEALVRWIDSDGRVRPPADFLPLVDELGMTTQLGNWVIETACGQLAQWDKADLQVASISVNVSAIQFTEGHLLESIRQALNHHQLAPERLEIEILESTALQDMSRTQSQLNAIRDYGVQIAIDDFGTGYSSLSYLVNIPAHIIKLDRTFLDFLRSNQRQSGVLQAIISLAKSLDLKVVAEGVEDEQQWETLQRMGCDLMQGYFYSRPLPPEDFAELLRQQSGRPDTF